MSYKPDFNEKYNEPIQIRQLKRLYRDQKNRKRELDRKKKNLQRWGCDCVIL